MTWEWSHAPEAHEAARANVESQPREWLEVVFAEWRSAYVADPDSFSQHKYTRALAMAKRLPDDVLADDIWEHMERQATCSNGGHVAYCCPYQCHTVPFDGEEP